MIHCSLGVSVGGVCNNSYTLDISAAADKAVKKHTFITFCEELRRRNGTKPLHLYLDNLPAHRRQEVSLACERLNIHIIWNPPYRYDF